jgi:hypothetical protein
LLSHLYAAAETFLQAPGNEDDVGNEPPTDEETDDEKNDKKKKDKKDQEDDEGDDDETVARKAHDRRKGVVDRTVHAAAKVRNEKPPPEIIYGPKPFRTVKVTARMFDAARAKLGTPYTPIAPKLDDPDPVRRGAAAIIAAGAARERVRVEPPLPDSTNAAARFMAQRSLARIEAEKQFRKNGGFVRF